jgi:hypothetical protein
MAEITVFYNDGTSELFSETSRPGGSYCTSHKVEGHFVIIKDAWGKETIIPDTRILKVESKPTRW